MRGKRKVWRRAAWPWILAASALSSSSCSVDAAFKRREKGTTTVSWTSGEELHAQATADPASGPGGVPPWWELGKLVLGGGALAGAASAARRSGKRP